MKNILLLPNNRTYDDYSAVARGNNWIAEKATISPYVNVVLFDSEKKLYFCGTNINYQIEFTEENLRQFLERLNQKYKKHSMYVRSVHGTAKPKLFENWEAGIYAFLHNSEA